MIWNIIKDLINYQLMLINFLRIDIRVRGLVHKNLYQKFWIRLIIEPNKILDLYLKILFRLIFLFFNGIEFYF